MEKLDPVAQKAIDSLGTKRINLVAKIDREFEALSPKEKEERIKLRSMIHLKKGVN